MTTTKTLTELCGMVSMIAKPGARLAWDKQSEWQQNANGFRCCLMYQGRRMSLDFWQGTGVKGVPNKVGVLECVLSDATAEGMTFGEWCGEYGYDDDSREAHRTYRACVRLGRKVRELLGADFDAFFHADRD